MCHVTFTTLGNAPLEQETLMLAVEFIGETECSAVVRNVIPSFLILGDDL